MLPQIAGFKIVLSKYDSVSAVTNFVAPHFMKIRNSSKFRTVACKSVRREKNENLLRNINYVHADFKELL